MGRSKQPSFPSFLPLEKLPAVARALQETFGTTRLESATPLTLGNSGALVLRIVVRGQPYLLRLIMEVTEINDPARQYPCMEAAARNGIAPRVHYASREDAFCITDFIETKPWEAAFPSREALLKALVQTIQSIQSLPPFPPVVNYLDGVDGLIAQFQASALLPEEATQEHFRFYSEIQNRYPRQAQDLVSSHNDLNPSNILCDGGKLWVVDWESAFLNDRYVDLANVANGFVRDADQEEVYLNAYFGDTLDAAKRARFFLMQQVCHVFYAMVLFKFAADSRTPGVLMDAAMKTPRLSEVWGSVADGGVSLNVCEERLLVGKVFLNEALHNMKTPRFTEAIKTMAAVTP